MSSEVKRKLIEVALPLEAINRESAREKSIRHGHPSTLHLWWARRPLAACRAVIFAQLVDDPSAHPELFPTEEDQAVERKRLFGLIERLVVWENAGDEGLLREARDEIARCFDGSLPTIHDPFAGGGSIPLEAQRLGLTAHASDLNPVAVLINKALIEIPPRWSGHAPVFPGSARSRLADWSRAAGLAEDVRNYGRWILDEARRRIGHLYPAATLPDGSSTTPLAWIWARTIACPNPACGAEMPLVRSFWLSKKKDRPTWIRPVVSGLHVTYEVVVGKEGPSIDGTVGRQGAECVVCESPVPLTYVRGEGKAGRMGQQLMAVVAEGHRQRVYLSADTVHIEAAGIPRPEDVPDGELAHNPRNFNTPIYGLTEFETLFTNRQLTALTVLSELVREARTRILSDAQRYGLSEDAATGYAGDVSTYLAFCVSRMADYLSSTTTWASNPQMEILRSTFARQAIAMTWDFAEGNPFASSSGSLEIMLRAVTKAIDLFPAGTPGIATQADATLACPDDVVVATDPPYYNNITYADLADFFYVWLRHTLRDVYPDLLGTVLTPKMDELVASPYRFGGDKKAAERHFEDGFVKAFGQIRRSHRGDVPTTIFYAFKQTESDAEGVASTGWETMLNGLIEAGFSVTATWPMRTERAGRSVGIGTNALASSVVLACRPLLSTAEATTRRGLIQALHDELPRALRDLQQGSVAPVDLAQAAIGPGMAVFTRFRTVVEADGSSMSVRTALALINQVLDEVLAEQEGDFDSDTRFCVKWFGQFGWDEAPYGRADELSRSTNTSVEGLIRGGVFWARAGKARLLAPEDLTDGWDPLADERVSVWEVAVRLAATLDRQGVDRAARLLAICGQRVELDAVKELAYLLFPVCEKNGWTQSALLFNGLGTSWADLASSASHVGQPSVQSTLDLEEG